MTQDPLRTIQKLDHERLVQQLDLPDVVDEPAGYIVACKTCYQRLMVPKTHLQARCLSCDDTTSLWDIILQSFSSASMAAGAVYRLTGTWLPVDYTHQRQLVALANTLSGPAAIQCQLKPFQWPKGRNAIGFIPHVNNRDIILKSLLNLRQNFGVYDVLRRYPECAAATFIVRASSSPVLVMTEMTEDFSCDRASVLMRPPIVPMAPLPSRWCSYTRPHRPILVSSNPWTLLTAWRWFNVCHLSDWQPGGEGVPLVLSGDAESLRTLGQRGCAQFDLPAATPLRQQMLDQHLPKRRLARWRPKSKPQSA